MDRALFPKLKQNFGSELGNLLRNLNPLNDQQERSIFFFCNSLIQLMENVYLDLKLEENENDLHNQGWITIFSNWSKSDYFKNAWSKSSNTYGVPFRQFCERKFRLPFDED